MPRKLGRKIGHRTALLKNLGISLVLKERITTTLPKAKELRPVVERWITIAKKPAEQSLHAKRLLIARTGNKEVAGKLVSDIAKRAEGRVGGYTRILKLGTRIGDASPRAIIELVDKPIEPEEKKSTKEKKEKKTESSKKSSKK